MLRGFEARVDSLERELGEVKAEIAALKSRQEIVRIWSGGSGSLSKRFSHEF